MIDKMIICFASSIFNQYGFCMMNTQNGREPSYGHQGHKPRNVMDPIPK